MSLPKAYATYEAYFEACLRFLMKHQYLITVPNTHVLVHNVLENIGLEGLENLDLYDESIQLFDLREKSEFLNDFLTDSEKLSVEYEEVANEEVFEDLEAPVGEKKRYEVVKLAGELEIVCREHGCDTLVDLGSGLGYLDQRFHTSTGSNVLGVECDSGHHTRARQRQVKSHASSCGSVVYVQHTVGKQSAADIEGFLKDNFKSHGPVCVTGLHACSDLTIDGINVFLEMAAAKALVLMPCCYHRMRQEGDRFINFPLSATLKKLFDKYNAYGTLHVPFLRLASHPTRREQSLRDMVFSLMTRAALQLYAHRNSYNLKRKKRKPVKKCTSFDSWARQAAAGYELVPDDRAGDQPCEIDLEQLSTIWQSVSPSTFARAAVYIQLQSWLQPVAESLVLLDRLAWLESSLTSGSANYQTSRSTNCLPSDSVDCLVSGPDDCLPSGSANCLASGSVECSASVNVECSVSGSVDCSRSGSADCLRSGSVNCSSSELPSGSSARVWSKKLFSDARSPRCAALIAVKTSDLTTNTVANN